MSLIINQFYNLFWQNKACQNLFLLSKEELLDTKDLQFADDKYSLSTPRIILSNVEKENEYDFLTMKLRSENHNLSNEDTIHSNIKTFEPLIENFANSSFVKALEKLSIDIENKPQKFYKKIISLPFKNRENQEKIIVEFLQEYGFIGRHIKNFESLSNYINDQVTSKKNVKTILNEKSVLNLLEITKAFKDIYLNEVRKGLYNSNQILLNALHDNEDFKSRSQLFNLLFESKIIGPSNEDSFIECLECDPGTYKGILQLKISPKKLNKLKCPICQEDLKYHVTYRLHDDIYNIIKLSDGLLHNSVNRLLDEFDIEFENNKIYYNDIEIDTEFNSNGIKYLIECKMYKLNTTIQKLTNKINKHFKKLITDSSRINTESVIFPILLVNVTDESLIYEIEKSFTIECDTTNISTPRILNINQMQDLIKNLNN